MGIKNFSQFIKRYAPDAVDCVPISTFAGTTVAVDLHVIVYECLYGAVRQVLEVTDVSVSAPDERKIHDITVEKVLARLDLLDQNGITAVCVVDGPPHALKQRTIDNRAASRQKRKEQAEAAMAALHAKDALLRTEEDAAAFARAFQNVIAPTKYVYARLEGLIEQRGLEFVRAESVGLETQDAEGVCAYLCQTGKCDATWTNDSDYHVYGGDVAITKLVYRSDGLHVTRRSLSRILEQTALSFDAFRDVCIMMGTDFNPNIPRVGVVRSWKYIQQYGDVASLPIDTSVLDYRNVRSLFMSAVPA